MLKLTNTNVTPNVHVYLEKKDTSFITEYYDTPSTASGLPVYYANWDAIYWLVAPTPDAAYEITWLILNSQIALLYQILQQLI